MEKKSLLFRWVALVAAVMCAIGASAYDFYLNGFYYNIKENNTVEVTYKEVAGTDTYTGVINIPQSVVHDGITYQVTAIGRGAFSLSTLTEVNIPNSVTSIGYNAFRMCYSLEKVTMTDAVTTMGYQAFAVCSKLREIYLSDNVQEIPLGCFSWCDSLKAITLPHALRTIKDEAFRGTHNLKTITCMAWTRTTWENEDVFEADVKANAKLMVPHTYYDLYKNYTPWIAFSTITPLPYDVVKNGIYYVFNDVGTFDVTYRDKSYNAYSGKVTIPGTINLPEGVYAVEGIGSLAFYGCRNLTRANFSSNIKIIHDRAFLGCSSLTSMVIPGCVEAIEYNAFSGCSSLTTITLREGLKHIGSQAMSGIPLTQITLPASLEYIDGSALSCNTSLPAIHVAEGNTYYTSRDGVLYTIDDKILVTYPAGRSGTTYTVREGTQVIANNAFDRARSLEHINLPRSIKDVQLSAFRECNALQEMTFPYGMTTLGHDAMNNCNSMTQVTLPATITYIGDNAFSRCTSLNDIYVKATTPPYCDTYEWYDYDWDEDVIEYAFTNPQFWNSTLHVPEGSENRYRNAETWKKFVNIVGTYFEPEFTLGDVDGDNTVGIADVSALIDYILTGYSTGLNLQAGDVDGDNTVGIADVSAMIDYILTGNW